MSPRVLFYDIETAPNLSYVWGQWQQDVIEHQREWYIMCVSWKWQGEKRVHVSALSDYDLFVEDSENDFHVVNKIWEILDEADVVIAHNGDRFDIRKSNARFLLHGLGPTSPYQTVDTLKVARKHFMFNSNRLGSLGEHLGLGKKAPTGGFELWRSCMAGDPSAWRRMKTYAKQDTVLLEEVYMAMRPWMKTHPSLNLIAGKPNSCPICQAIDSLSKRGPRYTKTGAYQIWHCSECGSFPRSRLSLPEEKPNFVS